MDLSRIFSMSFPVRKEVLICKDDQISYYLIKEGSDTTLTMVESNGETHIINQRADIESKIRELMESDYHYKQLVIDIVSEVLKQINSEN